MSERLIIENRTFLSMRIAMEYIIAVINQGKISKDGTQYCYATSFKDGYVVISDLNKKSDKLILMKQDG